MIIWSIRLFIYNVKNNMMLRIAYEIAYFKIKVNYVLH